MRIYKQYRDAAISVVRHEPYRLAADVWGIGFKTADTIARAVGIPHDSPERIKAGLQHTLSEAADDGHCFLPAPNLLTEAAKILDVGREMVGPCLDELAAAEGVVRETVLSGDREVQAVYLVPFHRAERSLASGLLDLLHAGQDRMAAFEHVGWPRALAWLRSRTGADLAPGAGGGGATGADRAGRRADRGAGLWQELHGPLDRGAGQSQEGENRAGRADRAGRQTAG